MTDDRDPASAPLTRFERWGLVCIGVLVVAFGGVVLWRSAFQNDRKTDFGVYARAGYGVRAGEDIYWVCDNRGWHYCYPPPFAILMAPLADPWPFIADRTGYPPFWVGVAVWYVFSVSCTVFAVHTFAKAALPDTVRGSRRWWYARTVPVYVCLAGVGFTLSRGQVNLFLVAMLAGMFAAAVRGRAVASGLWFAGAVALKVIPGYLILYPFLRRDWRTGVGLAVGLFLLLGVLPAAVWGVDGAIENNKRFVEVVLMPGALGTGDQTRAVELTDATATHSQSFQAVLHNIQHPDPAARPAKPDRATRLAHWGIGGALTLATLLLARRRLTDDPADQLLVFGGFCALMLLITPISHLHYSVIVLPLVCGLWAKGLSLNPRSHLADRRTLGVLAAWAVCSALPMLPYPATKLMRDFGLLTFATLGLWMFGMMRLGLRAALVEREMLPDLPEMDATTATRTRAA